MGKLISDEEYSSFVNNSMTASKMLEVEQNLIREGEADATILSAIINYEINKKDADETWGFDDYIVEQNSFDKNVGKNISDTLIGETLKTSKKMKLNIAPEEVLKVKELFTKFCENEDKNVSTEQNLVNFVVEMRPGMFPEEALSYVQDVVKGVTSFTETFNEAVQNGSIDYKAKLQELATDLSLNDKYTLYLNFLVALGNLDASTFSTDKLVAVNEFEELKDNAYEVNGDVTQEQMDDLIAQIDSALSNNTFCLSTIDAISDLITQLPGGAETVTEFLYANADDVKNKQVMALCTFIAYQNGDLGSIPEGTTAEMIGISAAAGIEQEKIINDVKEGRTTFDKAACWIKIIGGIALYCGLAVIAVTAGIYLATIGMAAFCSLIGGGIYTLLVFSTISMICLCLNTGKIFDAIESVCDFAGDVYDKFVEYVRTTAYPWISEKIQSITAFIKGLLNSDNIKVNNPAKAASQIATANT